MEPAAGPARIEDRQMSPADAEHPVLAHGLDPSHLETHRTSAEPALAMADADQLSFVPDRPFATYCECPACYGGVEGNGVLLWTIEAPYQLTCRFCAIPRSFC